MAPEPASEKQRHYLCGLLKARGVQDGDCQSLISAVFPQGLTKREASAEIEQMKYMNGLPARWIHAYVRQLRSAMPSPSMPSWSTCGWPSAARRSRRGSVGSISKN